MNCYSHCNELGSIKAGVEINSKYLFLNLSVASIKALNSDNMRITIAFILPFLASAGNKKITRLVVRARVKCVLLENEILYLPRISTYN